MQPWDDAVMTDQLVDLVLTLPRERLDRIETPRAPGCYLQFFASGTVEPVLGGLIASGVYVAYVGVASRSLRERVGRYRRAVEGLDLDEQDIYLALLPCSSTASARFAEAALIDRLDPLLNGLGWGSRPPGATRAGRCSPVDALLPGRSWAPPASPVDDARARMQVVSHLARLDPGGIRWDPLPEPPPSGGGVATGAG